MLPECVFLFAYTGFIKYRPKSKKAAYLQNRVASLYSLVSKQVHNLLHHHFQTRRVLTKFFEETDKYKQTTFYYSYAPRPGLAQFVRWVIEFLTRTYTIS